MSAWSCSTASWWSASPKAAYNALRVAQSDGAAQVGLTPEALSPAKFYPKVVTATFLYLHRQQWEREIRPPEPIQVARIDFEAMPPA